LLQYPVEYAASSNALQNLRKQFNAIAQKCTRQSNILNEHAMRELGAISC
jgi:Zn-dependent membrane protease YugP